MGQNMGQIVRQQNFQRSPNLISICVDEIRMVNCQGVCIIATAKKPVLSQMWLI